MAVHDLKQASHTEKLLIFRQKICTAEVVTSLIGSSYLCKQLHHLSQENPTLSSAGLDAMGQSLHDNTLTCLSFHSHLSALCLQSPEVPGFHVR